MFQLFHYYHYRIGRKLILILKLKAVMPNEQISRLLQRLLFKVWSATFLPKFLILFKLVFISVEYLL